MVNTVVQITAAELNELIVKSVRSNCKRHFTRRANCIRRELEVQPIFNPRPVISVRLKGVR
jgi:hypothetical protein